MNNKTEKSKIGDIKPITSWIIQLVLSSSSFLSTTYFMQYFPLQHNETKVQSKKEISPTPFFLYPINLKQHESFSTQSKNTRNHLQQTSNNFHRRPSIQTPTRTISCFQYGTKGLEPTSSYLYSIIYFFLHYMF